jgi:hypothetical protein
MGVGASQLTASIEERHAATLRAQLQRLIALNR